VKVTSYKPGYTLRYTIDLTTTTLNTVDHKTLNNSVRSLPTKLCVFLVYVIGTKRSGIVAQNSHSSSRSRGTTLIPPELGV
jgi:hypothetical protein